MIRGLSEDSDYLIVCVLNIDKEYREKLEAIETQKDWRMYPGWQDAMSLPESETKTLTRSSKQSLMIS